MLLRDDIYAIEKKRKEVMKAAFELMVIGIVILIFVIIFDEAMKIFFIIFSCFYMITGGVGILSVYRKNVMGLRIVHRLIYLLILLNFVAGFYLGFSAIEMRLYPRTIEDKEKVLKGRKNFFYFMFLILSSILVFSGIYFLLKIAKLLKNYSLQETSFEMEKI
ncbi:hypothetical protein SteCoe_15748 [Stentor coeruleus]|uniref:Uncharacterized protein n=1 Tax=Stentor coeruleus TaxID=5963 RepID=A0A1R2C2X2_9CILI|nr:hypothetical protein SteCoe_15748 [Stentor coeruleus]